MSLFIILLKRQAYFATWLILTVLRPAIERMLLSCKSLKASSYLKHNLNCKCVIECGLIFSVSLTFPL